EARKAVVSKARVENAPIGKENLFEEGATDSLNDRAHHLVLEPVGIDHRARLPGLDHAHNPHRSGRGVDGYLGAGGHVSALFGAAGNAEAALRSGLILAPSESFGGGTQRGAEPRVVKVLQAELERIECHAVRDLVHMRLAGKIVGGRSKTPVGTLTQRR